MGPVDANWPTTPSTRDFKALIAEICAFLSNASFIADTPEARAAATTLLEECGRQLRMLDAGQRPQRANLLSCGAEPVRYVEMTKGVATREDEYIDPVVKSRQSADLYADIVDNTPDVAKDASTVLSSQSRSDAIFAKSPTSTVLTAGKCDSTPANVRTSGNLYRRERGMLYNPKQRYRAVIAEHFLMLYRPDRVHGTDQPKVRINLKYVRAVPHAKSTHAFCVTSQVDLCNNEKFPMLFYAKNKPELSEWIAAINQHSACAVNSMTPTKVLNDISTANSTAHPHPAVSLESTKDNDYEQVDERPVDTEQSPPTTSIATKNVRSKLNEPAPALPQKNTTVIMREKKSGSSPPPTPPPKKLSIHSPERILQNYSEDSVYDTVVVRTSESHLQSSLGTPKKLNTPNSGAEALASCFNEMATERVVKIQPHSMKHFAGGDGNFEEYYDTIIGLKSKSAAVAEVATPKPLIGTKVPTKATATEMYDVVINRLPKNTFSELRSRIHQRNNSTSSDASVVTLQPITTAVETAQIKKHKTRRKLSFF